MRNGAEIKSTQLGNEFDFDKYQEEYSGRCIPLFAIDPKHKLHVFVENGSLVPQSDWIVISLIQSDNKITISRNGDRENVPLPA